jgi:hypothetical protein
MICPTAKAEYFSQQDWTAFQVICPSGKSVRLSAATSKPVATIDRWAALRSDDGAGVDQALRAPTTSAAQHLQI